ncbi:hypothetical protein LV779_13430 [Streptomyces thinghirensis]|nr:hypothetical protein [Streptomyces thinghirensis]
MLAFSGDLDFTRCAYWRNPPRPPSAAAGRVDAGDERPAPHRPGLRPALLRAVPPTPSSAGPTRVHRPSARRHVATFEE